MNKPKQMTLFQSWGGGGNETPAAQSSNPTRKKGNKSNANKKKLQPPSAVSKTNAKSNGFQEFVDLCSDSDDDQLLMALEESMKTTPQIEKSDTKSLYTDTTEPNFDLDWEDEFDDQYNQQTSAVIASTSSNCATSFFNGAKNNSISRKSDSVIGMRVPNSSAIENLPGFDLEAGRLWIYPTNYPIRDYQYNIVQKALFSNTMVTLPTGLGKTFIAAVVMYNFFRWYPTGRIIFMAPTKPLVTQQIEACHDIMGIPMEATAEMTGSMQPEERRKAWTWKRVFFLTPQVLTNDLSRGFCPATDIKCVVIDEAHKALGNHAYCQVIRELSKYGTQFRVVALSATPGSDIKSVQQVLSNLLISNIELRTDDSLDIQPYTHERKIEKIVVPLSEELLTARDKYLKVIDVVVQRLKRFGVMYNRDIKSMSKFLILKNRDAFRQDPPPQLPRSQYGMIEGDFALCMSLYHGYELLQLHGLRSLQNFLEGLMSGEKGYGRTKAELTKNQDFMELYELLHNTYEPVKSADPNAINQTQRSSQLKSLAIGHPKMAKLEEIVVEHFQRYQLNGIETRIMIFSQYRDSVNEITEILNRHRPLVKVMSFVGHSAAGNSKKGFNQKEQLKVMREFRDGGYNTLVSTCVGEEGLDIGDVDLIICFDAHKSPIRLVQRMGRTGRKREGRVVMLVTEGKEEQIYNTSQLNKKTIHRAIQGAKSLVFYKDNPRMVPEGLHPACHKMAIVVPVYKPQNKSKLTAMSSVQAGSNKKSLSSDGFLTDAELRYWSEHLKVADADVPRIPESEIICLLDPKKKRKLMRSEQENSPNKKNLSLTDWILWQNRLQETHMVDHSLETANLVESLHFIDIQGTSTEDLYGEEMRLYLNKDDIILSKHNKESTLPDNSIVRFCVSGHDSESKRNSMEGKTEKMPDCHARGQKRKKLKEVKMHSERQIALIQPVDSNDFDDDFDCATEFQKDTNVDMEITENFRKENEDLSQVFCSQLFTVNPNISRDDDLAVVGTPPSTEDALVALNELETFSVFPCVDVLQLIDEWDQEQHSRRSSTSIVKLVRRSREQNESSGRGNLNGPNQTEETNHQKRKKKVSITKNNISLSSDVRTDCSPNVTYNSESHSPGRDSLPALDCLVNGEQGLLQTEGSKHSVVDELRPGECPMHTECMPGFTSTPSKLEDMIPVDAFEDEFDDALMANICFPVEEHPPTEHSQLTFTQALACVDSFNATKSCENKTQNLFPVSEIHEPQFELGFDFESDDDDDDIIPPSPVSSHNLHVSNAGSLKPARSFSSKKSLSSSFSKSSVPPCPSSSAPHLTPSSSVPQHSMSHLPSSSSVSNLPSVPQPSPSSAVTSASKCKTETLLQHNVEHKTCDADMHETGSSFQLIDDRFFADDFDPVNEIGETQPFSCHKQTLLIREDESSDLRCAEKLSGVQHVGASCNVALVKPNNCDQIGNTSHRSVDEKILSCKTPGKPVSTNEPLDLDESKQMSTDEESIIHVKRSKVFMSPELNDTFQLKDCFMSPKTPKLSVHCQEEPQTDSPMVVTKKRHLNKIISSDEESPLVRKCKRTVGLRSRIDVDDDFEADDDDFKDEFPAKMTNIESKSIASKNPNKVANKKKQKLQMARDFLDIEAEVSDDESVSSDEGDDRDMDRMEESFINDATQLSQSVVNDSVDQHAFYMRSIRSPRAAGAKYRLKYPTESDRKMYVCSQICEEEDMSNDDDDYEEDSFCVGSDFVESDVEDEESIVASESIIKPSKANTNKKRTELKSKHKRIQIADSSIEGDIADDSRNIIAESRNIADESRNNIQEENRDCEIKSEERSLLKNRLSRSTNNKMEMGRVETKTNSSNAVDSASISKTEKCLNAVGDVSRISRVEINTTLADIPQFSLGIEDLLDDCSTSIPPSKSAPSTEWTSIKPLTMPLPRVSNVSPVRNAEPNGLLNNSCVGSLKTSTSTEELRQQRIRLSLQRKEEFRKKFQTSPNENSSSLSRSQVSMNASSLEQKSTNKLVDTTKLVDVTQPVDTTKLVHTSRLSNNGAASSGDNRIVLVDSREISSAQQIVSSLRFKHKMSVVVVQLVDCDYITSNRMGIERKFYSDFTNGANRAKFLERMRRMCVIYDRPCLILEKDDVKFGEKDVNKPLLRSRYVENLMACLSQMHIKVLFSESQDETSSLIADLYQVEHKKNMSICVPSTGHNEQLLRFYCSLPNVSYVTALNLLYGFKKLEEFINSSVDCLEKRGKMERARASEIYLFLRHKFNPQMIALKS